MDLFNAGAEGLTKIEETFHLCPGQFSKKYIEKNVLAWARNAFTLLAMVDYPYPAKFMADLPGHPVNLACSYMTGKDKLAGLANITRMLLYFFLILLTLLDAKIITFQCIRMYFHL